MSLLELKQKYNKLVIRHNKAVAFLDNPDIPLSQKEKWVPEFKKIIQEMYALFDALKEQGHDITLEEVRDGFKEVM